MNPQAPQPMPQSSPAPAQQAPMPPQGQAQQAGPQRVADIGFNQDIQNVLLSRIDSLPPQEVEMMDAFVTPQNIGVLTKVFPEIAVLFQEASSLKQGGQPSPTPAPAVGGQVQQQASAPMPQSQPSPNPLVRDGVSSGLVG